MAVSAFQKLMNKLLQQFVKVNGRHPQTPKEYMDLQNEAVQFFNKTKGVPPGPQKPPFQGWSPHVIQGGKKDSDDLIKWFDELTGKKEGIGSLIKPGDVKKGVAPKTTKETLKAKKDRGILLRDADEDIARIKRENKQAIEDFKKKHGKKTVEDLRDEGDWDPYGMASGGRTGYAAGKIVKGGKWFIKNLEQALKEVAEGTFKKELGPMEKEAFKWELKGLIGRIKMGEPLPDDMIQTIRNDPKFANITKTRSTDPDLYEFEDVILNYGKKGDVVDKQVEILEKFTPTGKGNAEGGRIGMMYGGDPGFAFEYGGSWADWHDQHRNTMPIEQYIQTKLPKARLPFREMQTGGLAYMLGEPTYMKYSAGGSVGHAPWHKPTGHAQPTAQQETPTPHVAGTPDPLKAPRGIPSLAPKNMDPAYMQKQMMQKAMMGQGPRPMAAGGGIMRAPFSAGGFNAARRAFLKWLGGITGAGIVGGTGLLKLGSKVAPKAIKETTEVITRGADGMPAYINDLITVVKAKGTRDIVEGFKKTDYSTVHSYKGVDVIEHPSGATTIKKQHEGGGHYTTDEGVDESFDGITREIEMEIIPGEYIQKGSTVSDDAAKAVKAPDEFREYTARPDMDGKMKDVDEYIDDMDHLELKEIADEANPLRLKMYNEDMATIKKTKKASGGLAYALGE